MVTLALVMLLGQTRYLFELDGVPVGSIELKLEGKKFTYRSTQAYRRLKDVREDDYVIEPSRPVPEGFWLWHKPPPGCVDGITELTNETGKLCADEVGRNEVTGTAMGKKFSARYDTSSELEVLEMGKSRFVRTDRPLVAGQPYAAGFPVTGAPKGKKLALDPPLDGTRWPFHTPQGTLDKPLADGDSCLETAQAFVAASNADYRLALGVVIEKGRAYPHAWAVSDTAGDVDPSARATKGKSKPNTAYLELPRDQAGALYVDLLEGKRKLVWK